MTTYDTGTAEQQLAAAKRVLDTHITSRADGQCLACGVPGPCHKRENAVVIFSRTLRTPRRHPAATSRALVGARRPAVGRLPGPPVQPPTGE